MIFENFCLKNCPICNAIQCDFNFTGLDIPVLQKYEVIGAGKRKAKCKKCGSTDRERLVYLYLRDYLKIFKDDKYIKILHIAPETNLSKRIGELKNCEYVKGDWFEEGYQYDSSVTRMNVCDIPFPAERFDLVICNHVLEHVEDDAKAMSELFRVLKSGGKAILQVPISNLLEKTLEDSSITDPEKRLEMFGQKDHLRLYGKDYVTRLIKAGFEVEEILISKEKKYKRFCLNPNEKIFACKKR